MVRSKRRAVLTVLLCLTVLLAGCSGWGSDGPSDDGAEPNGTDDLEDANAETGDEDNEPNDSAADEGADDGDEAAAENEGAGDEDADPADDSGANEDDGSDEDNDDAGADDGDAEEGNEADGAEGDGTDGNESDTDDADEGGDADETDGSTLTVETADVVTDDPVDADVIAIERGGETVGEASGTSATFDGLEDGEYDLVIYDDLGDWTYGDTITIDGEDLTHVAEIDQEHTYWPGVEVTVVDGDGEPVEGETVTINGEEFVTGPDGTTSDEIESSYTDEREFVVEYGEQSETVEVDWESWNGEPETVTFELQNGGESDDAETAALMIAA